MTEAESYLGKEVEIVMDRPLGSLHPERGFEYLLNYGYVPGTISPDGEELDAYLLGIDKPVEKAKGRCIAIVKRTDDDDDKLILVAEGKEFSDEEIEKLIEFQEKFHSHKLIRQK